MIYLGRDSVGVGFRQIISQELSTGAPEKAVNFIDYDGTIVASFTKEEALVLDALPPNPTHEGLTAQGWNWTLAEIKSRVLDIVYDESIYVGQMYVTTSGKTELFIEIVNDNVLDFRLYFAMNGTGTIDWGDNTEVTSISGNSDQRQYVTHAYAQKGSYKITISVTSGKLTFVNQSSSLILSRNFASQSMPYNMPFASVLTEIRLGNDISLDANAFAYCTKLQVITIPSSVTVFGASAFYSCYSLRSITIPRGTVNLPLSILSSCCIIKSISLPCTIETVEGTAFSNCYCLEKIAAPNSLTSFSLNCFNYCYGLKKILMPTALTSIGNSAFNNCRMLDRVHLKNNITTIGESAFSYASGLTEINIPNGVTTINKNAFQGCYSLMEVIIPSTVTSIGDSAFISCSSLSKVYVKPTTPPTLGSSVFNAAFPNLIIYVPAGCLDIYQNEPGWSTYASKMQEEVA